MNTDIIKHLQAERVDIAESDGTLRMSLHCSGHNQPTPDTVSVHEDNGASGIRFYNNEGNECGGLSLSSNKTHDGYSSSLSMTFGPDRNDCALQSFLSEENGIRKYGYTFYDRPLSDETTDANSKENVSRMFLGKEEDGTISVRVNDSKGRERIRLLLNAEGIPEISVLDETGNIIANL